MKETNIEYSLAFRSLAEDAMPQALLEVITEFDQQGISYCYWKSSRRLHQVLTGEGDVDLLIARDDEHGAQAILLKQGFKPFPSVADHQHPGMLSFFGFDELSGRLIHLHLHFSFIIGEPLLKNYRIPWEAALLARATTHATLPIRILDAASEAVLLVVRACLEFSWLDPIAVLHRQAKARELASDRLELAGRVDRATLRDLAASLLSEDLADLVANALYSKEPLERKTRLRRLMRRHFACCRSYNASEARVRNAGRALVWFAGNLNKRFFHTPRPWNRRAPCGGRVVAILGVDGSGKSTSVATIRSWLGSKIDVMPIYLGTGDGRPSLVLWPFKLTVPLVTRVLKTKRNGVTPDKNSGDPPGLLYTVLLVVWATAVALDKRKKLVAARRGANRGLIVIADRYPQNQIEGFNDGPLLARLSAAPDWLRRMEARIYSLAQCVPPDLIIKLTATPETISRREPEMDPAIIARRIADLQRLEFQGARVVHVDAEQPLAEMTREIKREIWHLL